MSYYPILPFLLPKGNDILVYMPPGSRRMERFRATTAANEIRDEDHAGDGEVIIIGKTLFIVCFVFDKDQNKLFKSANLTLLCKPFVHPLHLTRVL